MKFFLNFSCKEFFPHCSHSEIVECLETGYFDNILRLFQILDAFRNEVDYFIRVTSSFRNLEHNKSVGGFSVSLHLFGMALDFQPVCSFNFDTMVLDFQEFLKKSAFKSFVGQVIIYDKYIHFSLRTRESNYVVYDKRTSKKSD